MTEAAAVVAAVMGKVRMEIVTVAAAATVAVKVTMKARHTIQQCLCIFLFSNFVKGGRFHRRCNHKASLFL